MTPPQFHCFFPFYTIAKNIIKTRRKKIYFFICVGKVLGNAIEFKEKNEEKEEESLARGYFNDKKDEKKQNVSLLLSFQT